MYIFCLLLFLHIELFYSPNNKPQGRKLSVDLVAFLCPLFAIYSELQRTVMNVNTMCKYKVVLNKTK